MAIGANGTIAATKLAARRMSLMVSFFPARQRFAGICLLRAQARRSLAYALLVATVNQMNR
jgi:hypothetical protein